MQTVRAVVSRDPEQCWRAFTDAATLAAWVPGLRKLNVVQVAADGLPTEILFEFGASRTYSLGYTYDVDKREVRWEPRTGKHDAVAGFARFEAFDGGTRVTYGLKQGTGRTQTERELGEVAALLDAFVRWMQATQHH